MIVQLGPHQFDVDFGYSSLEKTRRWDWEGVPIIGDDPILHYSGRTREISFTGDYWNYIAADDDAPLDLADLADRAEPQGLDRRSR